MFVLVLWGCSPADRRCLGGPLAQPLPHNWKGHFPTHRSPVSLFRSPGRDAQPSLSPFLPPLFPPILSFLLSVPVTEVLIDSDSSSSCLCCPRTGVAALHSMPGKMLPLRSWHCVPWTERPGHSSASCSLLCPQQAQCSEVHDNGPCSACISFVLCGKFYFARKTWFYCKFFFFFKCNFDIMVAQTYNPHTWEVEAGGLEIGRSFLIRSKFEAT